MTGQTCKAGKTADDCPDCAHFKEAAMGYGSGHCYYPKIVKLKGSAASATESLVGGPYISGQERRFKQDVLRELERQEGGWSFFCIESPGTADGFPDVLALSDKGRYQLFEFKVSDAHGVIHFQKTQPLFYRKNSGLDIWIIAWNVPLARAERFPAERIVQAKSLRFQLPKL
jgi:hypothetical protein